MPRTHAPVSSFGSELHSVLRQGANEEVRLEFNSGKQASRFIARLNALRSAMRAEKHPDADQLYRAGARIDEEDSRVVIVSPKDSEFRSFIKTAGVGASTPNYQIQSDSDLTPPTPTLGDPADSFLATLSEPTTKTVQSEKKALDKKDE